MCMRAFAAPKKGYKKAYFKTVCRTIESSVKPEQTATMCRAKIPTKILKSIVLYHCSGAYFDCDRVKKRTVKNKLVKLRNLLQYIKISLRATNVLQIDLECKHGSKTNHTIRQMAYASLLRIIPK